MTLLDTLQHEYGWTFEYALKCSLARAFAFYAAIGARYNHTPSGPTYEEAEMIAELEAAKKGDQQWQA